MIVYYRLVTTYQGWPNNDCIDTDEVLFSTHKRRFENNIFLNLNPDVSVEDRKIKVADALGIKRKNVKLEKLK